MTRRGVLSAIMAIGMVAALVGFGVPAGADPIIGSFAYPGFSAKDILTWGGSREDGVYWIDPDLPGGNGPLQAYADMTTAGGGWTLMHSAAGTDPDVPLAAAELIARPARPTPGDPAPTLRFRNAEIGAYYAGFFGDSISVSNLTFLRGNVALLPLYGLPSTGVDTVGAA